MSDTVLEGTGHEDAEPVSGATGGSPGRSRRERRRRRHRRMLVALVVTAAAALVALDVVSVLAQRSQDEARRDLHDRRVATRRDTNETRDESQQTTDSIGAEVGERDLAHWYAAGTQQDLDASSTELGGAQSTSSELQGRIDALNSCIDGVNQTLGKLAERDRAAAAATLGFVSPACNRGIGATGGRAPVLAFDFPDPFVLRVGETYYAYSTNGGGGDIQIATSPDLQQWSLAGNALAGLPRWGAPHRSWAPSVLPRTGPQGTYYVLYYTVGAPNRPSCISRAVAGAPTGPFVDDSSGPLACPSHGDAIDPSPFVDGDRAFLTWRGADARIWSQSLADDGLSLVGGPHALDRTRPVVGARCGRGSVDGGCRWAVLPLLFGREVEHAGVRHRIRAL